MSPYMFFSHTQFALVTPSHPQPCPAAACLDKGVAEAPFRVRIGYTVIKIIITEHLILHPKALKHYHTIPSLLQFFCFLF